jgi:hypothetical protein
LDLGGAACRDGAEGEEMNKRRDLENDVLGYLSSTGTDKLADYATRGRKHQHLSTEDLTIAWKTAVRAMVDDVLNYELRSVAEDLKSEFLLRKTEPPYHFVREDMDRYFAEVDRAIQALKNEDPAKYEAMSRGVVQDLEEFKAARDRNKN